MRTYFFPLKVGTDGDYEASNRTKKKDTVLLADGARIKFVCVCDVNYMRANYCMDQKKSKYLLMCSGKGKKSCFIFKWSCNHQMRVKKGHCDGDKIHAYFYMRICSLIDCEKAPIWCTIVFLYEQPKFKSGSGNLWSHLPVFFLSPLCSITISNEMQNIVSNLTHFLMIHWCIWHTLSYSSLHRFPHLSVCVLWKSNQWPWLHQLSYRNTSTRTKHNTFPHRHICCTVSVQ